MPQDVGEAIVAYLRHGRPSCTSRRVFLRAIAPIRGFATQCAVGTIVRDALLRAGIEAPTMGAHQFRHGLATQMLRQGASLAQIGELLGHKSPDYVPRRTMSCRPPHEDMNGCGAQDIVGGTTGS